MSLVLKRAFDLLASIILLVLSSPIWLVTIPAIWLDTRGPIFYRHDRVGQHGKRFHLLKFRSMVPDADKIGGPLTSHADPRITSVGRFLRKWKIDELPNLLNVVSGEMSLVGPRPEAPRYVDHYTPEQRRVLDVKPGITDMATIGHYRDEEQMFSSAADPEELYLNTIMPEKLRLNLLYVEKAPSFRLDLSILIRTVASVLFVSTGNHPAR
ncbi:MAG: sugar transferase [Fidelibacterota bacterium]|nr:MAG: sugar transferase [Candidatus Neomarinimicrobiota bacterium]